MNKLKTLFLSILIGSFAGAIASFAFSSPGSNQPPNGNPIFWLLSGTSMYYTAGNVGIGTTTPGSMLDVNGTTQLRGASGGTGLYVNSSGNVGVGTASPAATLDVSGTGSLKMPIGTTAQRPSTPATGMMRFNTDNSQMEFYNGAAWFGIGGLSATGGIVVDSGGYRTHTFTTSGTFTVSAGGTVQALVVAGGGGSGYGNNAGGGGGGGMVEISRTITPGTYTVTVGAGGISPYPSGGNGISGENSVFDVDAAIGGGAGSGGSNLNGSNGGSGGGSGYNGSSYGSGGSATQGNTPNGTGYGNNGKGSASAATGGGAGASGTSGGTGRANSISGSSIVYAAGGNSGSRVPISNTGNGGAVDGGSGASGIVIIRYLH